MEKYIPYGRQHIDEEDINEVVKTLKSDWLTTGPKVKEFEDKFCEYTGAKYAIAISNGTAALDTAVQVLDLPEDSEIITTPFTFIASSNCILYNKCKPIFVDIKEDTFNINPRKIEEAITPKTKAILYVDYAGQPCEISELKDIANKHNLFLIEDACHAVGSKYKGKRIGSFADLTIFSFHPVKHITTGEGGMITTNNETFYNKLLMLRNHGIDKDCKERFGPTSSWEYNMKYLGRNYRITDFQCALGISQLKKLNNSIIKRNEIAEEYNIAFKQINKIKTPHVKENIYHAWHLYTILLDKSINRDEFFRKMRKSNIGVNVHYIPIYKHGYYKNLFNIDPTNFPNTENVFSRIITLPLHGSLKKEEVEYIIEKVKEAIR
jgi:UDP-4-amino-4,6-dideoxy-N-acetyl-beta-L-altrosamine transaminase